MVSAVDCSPWGDEQLGQLLAGQVGMGQRSLIDANRFAWARGFGVFACLGAAVAFFFSATAGAAASGSDGVAGAGVLSGEGLAPERASSAPEFCGRAFW